MSETQEKKQLTPEERKALREKYTIHDKENETIYRHFGDLNGADFKLRKNKNCEIYILDWTKGMYIDDCEDCTRAKIWKYLPTARQTPQSRVVLTFFLPRLTPFFPI